MKNTIIAIAKNIVKVLKEMVNAIITAIIGTAAVIGCMNIYNVVCGTPFVITTALVAQMFGAVLCGVGALYGMFVLLNRLQNMCEKFL